MELNETSRKFAFPNITKIGNDLVLTTRDYFVIITPDELEKIKEAVIEGGKTIYIHNEKILVYMKDNHVIFETLKSDSDFRRILMVNVNQL
jgi:hypothetical protein